MIEIKTIQELTPTEKENQKSMWEQWIDESNKGFKDVLMRVGRMI